MVSLKSCDRLARHRPQNSVDRSGVITISLKLPLHLRDYRFGRQVGGAVNRAVVWIIGVRIVSPCRKPITGIPVPPTATYKNDAVEATAPPSAIMPRSVVITKDRILPATKLATAPVVRHRRVCTAANGNVSIHTNVSFTVHSRVASNTSLLKVRGRAEVTLPHPRVCSCVGTNSRVWMHARRCRVGPL